MVLFKAFELSQVLKERRMTVHLTEQEISGMALLVHGFWDSEKYPNEATLRFSVVQGKSQLFPLGPWFNKKISLRKLYTDTQPCEISHAVVTIFPDLDSENSRENWRSEAVIHTLPEWRQKGFGGLMLTIRLAVSGEMYWLADKSNRLSRIPKVISHMVVDGSSVVLTQKNQRNTRISGWTTLMMDRLRETGVEVEKDTFSQNTFYVNEFLG